MQRAQLFETKSKNLVLVSVNQTLIFFIYIRFVESPEISLKMHRRTAANLK